MMMDEIELHIQQAFEDGYQNGLRQGRAKIDSDELETALRGVRKDLDGLIGGTLMLAKTDTVCAQALDGIAGELQDQIDALKSAAIDAGLN